MPTSTPLTDLTQSPPSPLPPLENRNSKIENPPPRPPPFLTPASLTLLLGDPGTGKSLLAIDLAAHLSRGNPLPIPTPRPRPKKPASSLLLSLEDSPATIAARFLSARANLALLTHNPTPVDLVPPTHGTRKTPAQPSSLLALLTHTLTILPNFQLLILDPLPAFLGLQDCSHQGTIRKLLKPLLQLAQDRHFAILGITHLAKAPKKLSADPLHRAIGSLAYTALARTVLLVTHDTLTHHPDRRLVIPLKQNFAPNPQAFSFTLQTPNPPPSPNPNPNPSPSDDPDDPDPLAAHLQWDPHPLTQHPLLNLPSAPPEQRESIDPSQLKLAEKFLTTMLAQGPVSAPELQRSANTLGLSRRTLQRARANLNVEADFDGTQRQWMIKLPTSPPITT